MGILMLNFSNNSKIAARVKTAFAAVALCAIAACDSSAVITDEDGDTTVTVTSDPATANLVDTAVGAGTFTSLVAALQLTGLDDVLADDAASFTVFAPTDDAFAALGSDTIDALFDDPDTLMNILLGHVIPGAVDSETAVGLAGTSIDAANGEALAVSVTDGVLFINSSEVIDADINATNGVIHVIDAVLLPGRGGGSAGGSGDGSGGSDDGSGNGSGDDSGGGSGSAGDGLVNIVETATAAGSFNTLAAALGATGLDTVLADESTQFTVFAPTDAAFDALGQDAINALLSDTDTLSDILLYHVISGAAVDAKTAVSTAGSTVTAANGDDFALSLSGDNLFVNSSRVTVTDVIASNGIIHVIDAVLTPPAPIAASGSIVDVAVADGRFTTLVAALQATGLDSVLADQSSTFTVFAPTDDAFSVLSEDAIKSLFGDIPALSDVLLTHVLSGVAVDSVAAFAANGTLVPTASGVEVVISIQDGALFVNKAQVVITDITTDNGIIHVIDSVIQ